MENLSIWVTVFILWILILASFFLYGLNMNSIIIVIIAILVFVMVLDWYMYDSARKKSKNGLTKTFRYQILDRY